MASNYGHHQFPDHGQQEQLFLSTNNYNYIHDGGRRSKSPASMTNNPRISPGPLSTPPHSRDTSQPPEQLAEQIMYDDGSGSQSDSPISVATPDNDSFTADMMLDESMGVFYQESGVMVSSQMQQDATPAAMDLSLLIPSQAMPAAFSTAMPAQDYHYQNPVALQSQHFQNLYHEPTFQNYPTQLSDESPWTPQRPPLNPEISQPSQVMFDPVTDPKDYSPFVPGSVAQWMQNNTDPNYLVSPNEPPSATNFYSFAPQIQRVAQVTQSNVSSLNLPLLPSSNRSFGNPAQSISLPTDESFGSEQFHQTSPNSSSEMWVSVDRLSPVAYAANISPQTSQISAPSPGGSDTLFPSYQHSESGMASDGGHSGNEEADVKKKKKVAKMSRSSSGSSRTVRHAREHTFHASPEPDSARRRALKGVSRNGGRALGTHLDPGVAKAAHDMRKTVACWHCVLQRDKCGPGEICDRCNKRSQRPNADCGLGCSRVKLIELSRDFLPSLVTQMHENTHLTHFVNKHIRQWGNVELTIYMTCGQYHMPRIPVKVYEFVPADNELLVQVQYITDPATHTRVAVKKESPALGMVQINQNEEKKYEKYISDIVDHHLDSFGELAWMEDDNDFQQKLFRLMIRVKCKNDDEKKLLHEVFRFIVVTFIMSHTLTIAEETKHTSLSKMHSYQGTHSYVQNYTSPRMTNRQLKYFFSRIQKNSIAAVLNKLQQIFKSSRGCDKWLAAFIAVLGLCMAHEDQQQRIHTTMASKAADEGKDPREMQMRAEIACREIDERMGFIYLLFRWKYNRKCNPLRDSNHAWEHEVGFGDEDSVIFVRRVAQLVTENIDFLQRRQSVSISDENQTKYTSRLVGQFLLSFWLPQI